MREISFVKRLKFNFGGSVTKKALVIGDADNDRYNELVCANLQGELAIFKDKNPNKFAYASNLGMVTACVVGDVINAGKNFVVVINTEGWLFLFDVPRHNGNSMDSVDVTRQRKTDSHSGDVSGIKLDIFYNQRMPANCKELLLADLDGDNQIELIIGLTDRVLRTYRWINIGPDSGKFVGLYKWEFADQIGAVSLNPSQHENCQDIIVAQPGGTYAKLECFDKKPTMVSSSTSDHLNEQKHDNLGTPSADGGDNIRTEYISKLTPEYHQLALAQMRNHHISTEILGGIRDFKGSETSSLIVIATLDGTLMLVNKDEILWSLQVDHQLFALAVVETISKRKPTMPQSESTCTIVPNSNLDKHCQRQKFELDKMSQYFFVCAWNGKTYIIDEERNYLRFKFDDAVSAFTAGNYYFDGDNHTCLVYASFSNQVVLYYDVILDHIRPMYLLEEILNNQENADLAGKLEALAVRLASDKYSGDGEQPEAVKMQDLLRDLLYSLSEDEISQLTDENHSAYTSK